MFKYVKSIFVFCICFIIINCFLVYDVAFAEVMQSQLVFDEDSVQFNNNVLKINFTGNIEDITFKAICYNETGCNYNGELDAFGIRFINSSCDFISEDYYNFDVVSMDYVENRDFNIDLTTQEGGQVSVNSGDYLMFINVPSDFIWNGTGDQTDFYNRVDNCPSEENHNASGYYIINGNYDISTPELTAVGALGAMAEPLINNSLQFLIIIFSDYWAYLMILTIISILILYFINFVNKIIK